MLPSSTACFRIASLLRLVLVLLAFPSVARSAVETYFIDKGGSFNGIGAYWHQQFTVGSTKTFVLRFTSDYAADCAVFKSDQLANFVNNRSFSGYAMFDNSFGTKSVTLGPGTYYVGARAQSQTSSAYRLELDYDITVPKTAAGSWSFVDVYIQGSKYVDSNGGRIWHGFTIQSGYRYFIDGCNPGMSVYIIPAGELSAFTSGGSFQYYTSFSGTDPALPGLSELNLAPGSYYLAVHNGNAVDRPVTYTLERWKAEPVATGKLDLAGPASWKTKGKRVKIKVAKVANLRNSGKSGSLRLRLWAVKKRYQGGRLKGHVIGTRKLGPLKAGYQYKNLGGRVALKRPPSGRYRTTLTLEEYTRSGWKIRDFISFPGRTRF